MKTIVITTTDEKKNEVLRRYSVLAPSKNNEKVTIDVVIDDSNSEVFKNLSKDPDVLDWDFKAESVSVPSEGFPEVLGPGPCNPPTIHNISPIADLIKSLDITVSDKDIENTIDLKDMNQVIWWCTKVYMKELFINPDSTPERTLRKCLDTKGPFEVVTSDIWNGLSEGLVKMILVLMSHGTKEFSKTLHEGLIRAGHYYLDGRDPKESVVTSNEEFLHHIFIK